MKIKDDYKITFLMTKSEITWFSAFIKRVLTYYKEVNICNSCKFCLAEDKQKILKGVDTNFSRIISSLEIREAMSKDWSVKEIIEVELNKRELQIINTLLYEASKGNILYEDAAVKAMEINLFETLKSLSGSLLLKIK